MIHDPIAAKALLLHLGCPELEVDAVFSDYSWARQAVVPDSFLELMAGLREAMRARGIEPTS